jgi:hypothetical protein
MVLPRPVRSRFLGNARAHQPYLVSTQQGLNGVSGSVGLVTQRTHWYLSDSCKLEWHALLQGCRIRNMLLAIKRPGAISREISGRLNKPNFPTRPLHPISWLRPSKYYVCTWVTTVGR